MVDKNGKMLFPYTAADQLVVTLFAYLHDAWRLDDFEDRDHGRRAADGLKCIPALLLNVSQEQMKLLDYAIRHHVDGKVSDGPTIGTCWDADRLDLGRVGTAPDERRYMSTEQGKSWLGNGLRRVRWS